MGDHIKRILVAVDFGEPSLHAVNISVSLAKNNNASLHLLHVTDDPLETSGKPVDWRNDRPGHATSVLTAMINDIQSKSGIAVEYSEHSGPTTETILKEAALLQCDLIVMGTYGASGYRKGYIGSTTYRVIKYAQCPVLFLPANNLKKGFNRPLLPVRPVITALRHYDFFRELLEPGASLTVLGIYPAGQDNNLLDLKELISNKSGKFAGDNLKVQIAACNTANTIPQSVLAKAEEFNSDLIILTPATDVSNKQFYVGPHTHYIMHNARVPVLIMHRQSR